eukprot:TRINITY_DN5731_c0_g1_i1.p1 TRINITY_DN5731_c0_g1~~TRINITY_DN5731_c0_g1_i1.p1  ORF type:complete len:735 (-),score=344.30 TRINITY_DN5731_c0_g1_i1:278-2482(-)
MSISRSLLRVNTVLRHLSVEEVSKQDKSAVSVNVDSGIALIQIRSPPVNSFSPAVKEGLDAAFKKVAEDSSIKAAILTGSGAFFMAGADIPSIQKMQMSGNSAAIRKFISDSNAMCNAIENSNKPIVAALNGPALGGGLELAMSCHVRVSVTKAQLGLPELRLGIFPGMGGTQRLPRLVGMPAAVNAMMTSKPFNVKQAAQLGLVDEVVEDPKQLLAVAKKVVLELLNGQRLGQRALTAQLKVADVVGGNKLLDDVTAQAKKKSGSLPHPLACLEAIREGLNKGGIAGLNKEMDLFCKVAMSPSARAGIHFFLSERQTSKVPGVTGKETKRKIQRVAIIGAGTMGAGIATVCLQKGLQVILKEINQKFLDNGVKTIRANLERQAKNAKLPAGYVDKTLTNLTAQLTYDNFNTLDLVIEAAVENIKLKQELFATLEQVCSPTCILSTNTSTINLDLISAKTKAQKRVIGLHFFSPAHVMPLLEIVRTTSTAVEVIADCVAWSQRIGKTPVVVGNCVGFVANRIFFPYSQAAGLLVDFGIDPYRIDKVLMKYGMPMGCFRMGDMAGVDIFYHVNSIINTAYGERCYNSTLGQQLLDAKRFGQKSGAGYYKHSKGKAEPDPELAPFIAKARQAAGNVTVELTDDEIMEIVMFPVVNESYRVVEEGVVVRPSDVDIISVMGYGYPVFRGGILHWADQVGPKYIHDKLRAYAEKFGAHNPAARNFFAPSALLRKSAGSA